ncbi:enoyl-CoA hydratase-related protein [Azospirillum canadense]|uniref:enoyl-CoA hydratase-related protein n=1 Tax=Azospirillum canadense TaxID=403962 RepID=UPI0022264889|nr:enoyl-CoA hydratase-related protein [Azospirillum canadense]MCW2241818.1 enoyl-CoA hydratase/carnithine racemase [Azospirillum canadense]
MSESLVIDVPEDGLRVMTIARPERRNALDRATYGALRAALAAFADDAAVRAVVLQGAGGDFTSGTDVADFRDVANAERPSAGVLFLKDLARFPKPIVAAVEGHAIGIGTTLLLHCDLAYAGRGARFRLPFVALGLCPEGASSYLLPRLAGAKRAAELLMLGDRFDADVAERVGLVNAITDEGGAFPQALVQARRLAALPAAALVATKRLLMRSTAMAVAESIDEEAQLFQTLRRSPEAQQAFAAFLMR